MVTGDRPRRPSAGDVTDRFIWWLASQPFWVYWVVPIALAALAMGALRAWVPGAPFHEYLGWSLAAAFVGWLPVSAALITTTRGRRLVRDAGSLAEMRTLGWRQFEELVGQVFRNDGWVAAPTTTRDGPDGGADVILSRGRERAFVQCKKWSQDVGVESVRAFYGVMSAHRMSHGFFVTTSAFTAEAERFGRSVDMELITGLELLRRVRLQDQRQPDRPTETACGEPLRAPRTSAARPLPADALRALVAPRSPTWTVSETERQEVLAEELAGVQWGGVRPEAPG